MIKEIVDVVKSTQSFLQAEKILKIDRKKIKKICIENNIDYSHFLCFKNKKNIDQYIGMTIYYLTIKDISTEILSGTSRKYAICECSCGNLYKVRLDNIINGRSKSCGCISKRRTTMDGRNNPSFTGCEDIPARWVSLFRYGAKRRNISFNITPKDVYEQFLKQDKKCSLTGQELYFGRCRWTTETNASLDRIDSLKGYEVGNIQLVTKNINLMKGSVTQEEFINNCKLVSEWKSKLND
jgi:hypothetical protein